MEKIVKRFEKMMYGSLLFSLLDIIVGFCFIKFPDLSIKLNVIILGSLILIHGLFYIIKYLYDGFGSKIFSFAIIMGVINCIFGIFVIFNPFDAAKIIGIFAGIWLVLLGAEKFYYCYRFAKAQEDISVIIGFIGVLLLIMGFLVMFNPFKTFMLIQRLIGIFLIAGAVIDALSAMLFKKRAKALLEIFD